jgi:hypothetical protein
MGTTGKLSTSKVNIFSKCIFLLSWCWFIIDTNKSELFGFFFFGLWTQWLKLALSDGPNWVGLPCSIHLRTEIDPVSETVWSFVKLPHTRRWIESKRSQIVLYNIHHRQNPFKSNRQISSYFSWLTDLIANPSDRNEISRSVT